MLLDANPVTSISASIQFAILELANCKSLGLFWASPACLEKMLNLLSSTVRSFGCCFFHPLLICSHFFSVSIFLVTGNLWSIFLPRIVTDFFKIFRLILKRLGKGSRKYFSYSD